MINQPWKKLIAFNNFFSLDIYELLCHFEYIRGRIMTDEKITRTPGIPPADFHLAHQSGNGENQHKHRKDEKPEIPDEVKDHFSEIRFLVERINLKLEKDKSPLRFEIDQIHDEITIDVIKIEPDGESSIILHKNITHQSFIEAVRHILNEEGFMIDSQG